MKKHPIDIRVKNVARHTVMAGALAAMFLGGAVQARGLSHPIDADYNARVSITGVAYPGSTVEISGRGFKAGQDVQLLRDGSPITTRDIFHIGEDGTFKGSVEVPPEAPVGLHPVVVQVVNPGAADVFKLKVSPKIPFSGVENFDIARNRLDPGLYQAAYSKKQNAVYVTSAVGRPPVRTSTLMKVNPDTLKVDKVVTPPNDSTGRQLQAVYGVAVDDANGHVWVGNTRTGSIGVYKQDDLSLVKQFPDKIVPHSRELAVDSSRGLVYAAAVGNSDVAVFDARTLEHVGNITLQSPTRVRDVPNPMGFAIDEARGRIYVVTSSEQIYVLDADTRKVEKVFNLKGSQNSTAVALAPHQQLLFVASQDTDNLLILDAETGDVKHDVKVGAGPLSVTWDNYKQVAYVASRGSDSIAVVDTAGKLVANLPGGSYANHVITDGDGTIFAVNKARTPDDPEGDHIRRIFFR